MRANSSIKGTLGCFSSIISKCIPITVLFNISSLLKLMPEKSPQPTIAKLITFPCVLYLTCFRGDLWICKLLIQEWCHHAEPLMDLKNQHLYLNAMEMKNKPHMIILSCAYFSFSPLARNKSGDKNKISEKYDFKWHYLWKHWERVFSEGYIQTCSPHIFAHYLRLNLY